MYKQRWFIPYIVETQSQKFYPGFSRMIIQLAVIPWLHEQSQIHKYTRDFGSARSSRAPQTRVLANAHADKSHWETPIHI